MRITALVIGFLVFAGAIVYGISLGDLLEVLRNAITI
jgi:hypothetical protein